MYGAREDEFTGRHWSDKAQSHEWLVTLLYHDWLEPAPNNAFRHPRRYCASVLIVERRKFMGTWLDITSTMVSERDVHAELDRDRCARGVIVRALRKEGGICGRKTAGITK